MGCATAPSLTGSGKLARQIDVQQAKMCRFIQVVNYDDRIIGMGKDGTVMKAIGDNSIRNATGAAGGNAYVLTKEDDNWFLGNISFQADAYFCP